MRKKIFAVLATMLCISNSITALAAPVNNENTIEQQQVNSQWIDVTTLPYSVIGEYTMKITNGTTIYAPDGIDFTQVSISGNGTSCFFDCADSKFVFPDVMGYGPGYCYYGLQQEILACKEATKNITEWKMQIYKMGDDSYKFKMQPWTVADEQLVNQSTTVSNGKITYILPNKEVFDADYYIANNPDVVNVMGTDVGNLAIHYMLNGRAEGRLGAAPDTIIDANTVTLDKASPNIVENTVYGYLYNKTTDQYWMFDDDGSVEWDYDNYSKLAGMNEKTGLPWLPGDNTGCGTFVGYFDSSRWGF